MSIDLWTGLVRNETADERKFTQMDPVKIGVYRRASAVPVERGIIRQCGGLF